MNADPKQPPRPPAVLLTSRDIPLLTGDELILPNQDALSLVTLRWAERTGC
jgi:hypothetical protein